MTMKTHPSTGELRSLLDEETSTPRARAVEEHLRDCPECRAEAEALTRAESMVSDALAAIDPSPDTGVALRRVRERLDEEVTARPGTTSASRPGRFARRSLAKAALLVLGLGVGVAAAVPGSPVRAWLGAAWTTVAGDEATEVEPAAEAPGALPEETAAIRLTPVDGAVRIELLEVEPGGTILVRLSDRGTAAVRAGSGSRFLSGPGRAEVRVEPGAVEVELPEGAARADVVVNGATYLRIRDGRIELPGPEPVSTDRGFRFRAPGDS